MQGCLHFNYVSAWCSEWHCHFSGPQRKPILQQYCEEFMEEFWSVYFHIIMIGCQSIHGESKITPFLNLQSVNSSENHLKPSDISNLQVINFVNYNKYVAWLFITQSRRRDMQCQGHDNVMNLERFNSSDFFSAFTVGEFPKEPFTFWMAHKLTQCMLFFNGWNIVNIWFGSGKAVVPFRILKRNWSGGVFTWWMNVLNSVVCFIIHPRL